MTDEELIEQYERIVGKLTKLSNNKRFQSQLQDWESLKFQYETWKYALFVRGYQLIKGTEEEP